MPTNRRDFLKRTASAGGVALGFGGLAPARALGAGERLRVGVLGSGQRAQYLMSLFNKVPDVEIVAVCDVYEPHREKALESASKDAQGTGEYREVLDRKDVYCEKPIMHSIPEGLEIVRAVGGSGRVVQTGMQQRSWEHYKLGKEI